MRHLASTLGFAALVLLSGCGGGGAADLSSPPPPEEPPPPPPEPPPPDPPDPPDPPPSPEPSYSHLHLFRGEADGANPYGVIIDEAGNLYGTTSSGGDMACPEGSRGCGTVFKIDAGGSLTTLHRFAGGADDGAFPRGGLIRDAAGNLYGGTFGGGNHLSGVVFKVDATGKETVLHHFEAAVDGVAPKVGLRDGAGSLYGTTGLNTALAKCSRRCGTVFKLDPAGKLATLHSFNGHDGDVPGLLTGDAAGNLYGTTAFGGDHPACIHQLGCGTVFKLDAGGAFTTLHAFAGAEREGEVPTGRLALDDAGNLYGTTGAGGRGLGGTLYQLEPGGRLINLIWFQAADGAEVTNDPGGQNPGAGVLRAPDGTLYGTTERGGKSKWWGVLFAVDVASRAETVLHTFTREGGVPAGTLAMDRAGNLYGTGYLGGDEFCHPPTGCGVVFKLRRE